MGWFRRRTSGGARNADTGVAADLAEFLVDATEGRALGQAIGDAGVHGDNPTPTAEANDAPTPVVAESETDERITR
jgi:hypothetical protein